MVFRGRKRAAGRRAGAADDLAADPRLPAVPLLRLARAAGLASQPPALVYIAILTPLATWMLKGFFDGIPRRARRRGADRRRDALGRVPERSSCRSRRSGLTAVFVITALLAWAEFVIPYILLTDPVATCRSPSASSTSRATTRPTSTGILAAGSVLAVLPAIVLFVLLQRFIVGALRGRRPQGLRARFAARPRSARPAPPTGPRRGRRCPRAPQASAREGCRAGTTRRRARPDTRSRRR